MAKAKKAESAETDSKKKPAAKKAQTAKSAGKKPAKASPSAAAPAGMPLIDTNAAAQAAAAMLLHRNQIAPATPQGEKKESAAFKQLKESLTKPTGPGGLLQNPQQQKKQNLGHGPGKQVGHNQTFGADVSRAFVPRRTSG